MEEIDPIPLSALQHWAYCPRQCELGRAAHTTTRDGARTEYALPIWSDRLGLIGKCAVVGFWPDGVVYAVRYKHGPRRAWLNDDIQLGARARCLQEMLGIRPAHALNAT